MFKIYRALKKLLLSCNKNNMKFTATNSDNKLDLLIKIDDYERIQIKKYY